MSDISLNQNVYRFYGNRKPFLFFSLDSSRGFIHNDHYYKEMEQEDGGGVHYIRSHMIVTPVATKAFAHLVNSVYYLLLVVLFIGSYNLNVFEFTVIGSGVLALLMWYLESNYKQYTQFVLISISTILILYSYIEDQYGVIYLVFLYIIISSIIKNMLSNNITYKVLPRKEHNTFGIAAYYIWTNGETLYTIKERREEYSILGQGGGDG